MFLTISMDFTTNSQFEIEACISRYISFLENFMFLQIKVTYDFLVNLWIFSFFEVLRNKSSVIDPILAL